MPPPALVPPGIGIRIAAAAQPPPPPPPASPTRPLLMSAFGLNRMRSAFRRSRGVGGQVNPLRAARASRRFLGVGPVSVDLPTMITAQQLEVRAGARLLMENVSFRIAAGDKVGLVGRNGAGKTTLTKILAGEAQPASGTVLSNGEVGYLPQDPRIGNPEVLARERILSARGLDDVVRRMREAEVEMAVRGPRRPRARHEALDARRRRAARRRRVRRRVRGRPDRQQPRDRGPGMLDQPLKTLSGGQRRRVELARILFSGAETLLLDEPTNHLDADSIVWLRGFLASHRGGLIVISHDNALLEATVNKVLHLDANRGVDRRLQHGLEDTT